MFNKNHCLKSGASENLYSLLNYWSDQIYIKFDLNFNSFC